MTVLRVQHLESSARYVPRPPSGPRTREMRSPGPECWLLAVFSPKRSQAKNIWEPKTGVALPVDLPSFLGGSGLILLVQTYNIIMILACFFFFFSLPSQITPG